MKKTMKKDRHSDQEITELAEIRIREMSISELLCFHAGARMAACISNQYNSSTTHPYMLGDCILLKLNMLDKKHVRRNIQRLRLPKEEK